MTKRFKPGAQVVLTEGDMLRAVTPLMSEVISEHGAEHGACRLTAEDIRRIQAADLLEDVPEPKTPGQRLYDEVVHGTPWDAVGTAMRRVYETHARNLGIKSEGE